MRDEDHMHEVFDRYGRQRGEEIERSDFMSNIERYFPPFDPAINDMVNSPSLGRVWTVTLGLLCDRTELVEPWNLCANQLVVRSETREPQ